MAARASEVRDPLLREGYRRCAELTREF
ncbi:MAG: hypothetical protein QOF52_778, partial [Propionibacteriaceae bacterium]|nr:hypothetical protein [Propionibacteriaceae bacterium]